MSKKENVPTIKESSELTVVSQEAALSNWGAIEEMETTDLLVPKIFHQQAMSQFVANGDARPGDFCDSLTGQVLAKKEEKLEIIIFGSFKTVLISKLDTYDNKFKYEKTVIILPENAREYANRPYQEEINGYQFKNSLYYNYYVLIPGMIKELPYVLSLGSTKTKAAKKLNTMLYKLNTLKRPGASVVFELSSTPEKNDQGSWFGLEVTQGRDATAEELMRAHAWYVKSKSQKFVVQEEENQAHDDDAVPF